MSTRKSMWILLSVFIVAAFLLGSANQVMAETWNCKIMNKLTKIEGSPIPDAEGHWVGANIREGATMCDNGEMGWHKTTVIWDGIKSEGTYSQYVTLTLLDGSTMTNYCQDKGIPGGYKWEANFINGTGRFKGIKGTASGAGKFLPPEKGEILGKAVGTVTFNFTLPSN
jgi:hypothetical protein